MLPLAVFLASWVRAAMRASMRGEVYTFYIYKKGP